MKQRRLQRAYRGAVAAAALFGGAALAVTPQQNAVSGWLHAVWEDPPAGSARFSWFLVESNARSYRLMDDGAGWESDAADLAGRRVTVFGRLRRGGPAERGLALEVESIRLEGAAPPGARMAGEPVTGDQRWVTILCRFGDLTTQAPNPPYWYESRVSSVYPGVGHFWEEAALDQIRFLDGPVLGWYDLPNSQAYYNEVEEDYSTFLGRVAEDCTEAADEDVYFPDFDGINLMVNDSIRCCAYGGTWTLNRDGQVRSYGVTWMPPWAQWIVGTLAHEMGHGYGLGHSNRGRGDEYDSPWDLMSSGGVCRRSVPDYGCTYAHPIAQHKEVLGWIPQQRTYIPQAGNSTTILLEPLDRAPLGSGYLMARLPIGDHERYTVEARRLHGYDENVPNPAVIIHHVGPHEFRPQFDKATLLDHASGQGWLPGAIFVDPVNEIAVSVDQRSGEGFEVTIHYRTPLETRRVAISVTGEGAGEVVSDPPGILCASHAALDGNPCSADFPRGTHLSLVALADSDDPEPSKFNGWSDRCEGAGPTCRFYLRDDVALTARFDLRPRGIIAVEPSRTVFTAMPGVRAPSARALSISNEGAGTLDDLRLGDLRYGSAASGWLDADLDRSGVPVKLILTVSVSPLSPGRYSAGVPILSEHAANSPLLFPVVLNVLEPVAIEVLVAAVENGGRKLPAEILSYLDGLGNADGRFDVGDFVAWFEATEPEGPRETNAQRREGEADE